ncbi:MAG TPA: PaaI family thioesterase [Polyangiaceae bacterium]
MSDRATKDDILAFAKHFPFFNLIGLELLDLKPRWSLTRITARPDLNQPAGILHGGIIASLIDTGIAQAMLLTDEFQKVRAEAGALVSVDLRVRYLRPVSSGFITCESNIVHLGRKIVHASSLVKNDAGKDVALGESIYMIVPGSDLHRG